MMSEDSKQNLVNDMEVKQCIETLESLVGNTDQLFEMPEEQRIALMKVAGLLSRPTKDEQDKRRKNAKKATKRKQREREKHARKETGIRSARESNVFEAPKMLNIAEIQEQDPSELESPRNCYVCKSLFTKLHHFYDSIYSPNSIIFMIVFVQNVEISIIANVFRLQI